MRNHTSFPSCNCVRAENPFSTVNKVVHDSLRIAAWIRICIRLIESAAALTPVAILFNYMPWINEQSICTSVRTENWTLNLDFSPASNNSFKPKWKHISMIWPLKTVLGKKNEWSVCFKLLMRRGFMSYTADQHYPLVSEMLWLHFDVRPW